MSQDVNVKKLIVNKQAEFCVNKTYVKIKYVKKTNNYSTIKKLNSNNNRYKKTIAIDASEFTA